MATDSTDLAFVRCPSCRSLVPAVSTKCRMCGAGLEAGAHDEGTSTTNPSGGEKPPVGIAASGGGGSNQQSIPASDVATDDRTKETIDPLAAYLDSLPEDDDTDDFDEIDELEDELDDFDDIEDEFEDLEEEVEQFEAGEEDIAQPEPEPLPKKEESVVAPAAPKAAIQTKASQAKKEEKPRVVIEQGKSRQGGRSFSFSKNKEEEKPQAPHKKADTPKTPPVHAQRKQEEYVQPASIMEEDIVEETPAKPTPVPQVQSSTGKESVKWHEPKTAGKLFGWLVSYTDSRGSSLELREGRFFVSAQALREEDLVLDHETISTPHAMFTISNEQGIIIQDLRSDRGVFIREQANAYRREYDTAELHHGDWVRFGDVEFLVCLISG